MATVHNADSQTDCCEVKSSCSKTNEKPDAKACLQCGQPVTGGSGTDDFCCDGCKAAYQIISQEPAQKSLSQFAETLEDGSHKLTLAVSGVHCASCISTIEGELFKHREVLAARVNMSTERLTFTWSGDLAVGDGLSDKIESMGYALKPLDQAALKGSRSEEEKRLLKAIAAAGFASGNLMLLSVGLWTNGDIMGLSTRDFMHWVQALIALPAVIYAGLPFFRSALAVLKQGYTNMDVPISLAITLATGMSIFETINQGRHVYFDSAVMLLFFLLIGRYLDARARGKARESAAGLLSKLVGTAQVVDGDSVKTLSVSDLTTDMILRVSVGDNIPADGVISIGTSDVDMSLITGESLPVTVSEGDRVYAGTTNMAAAFDMRVTSKRDDSLLSEIVSLMEVSEQGNAHFVRLADRAAKLYTPAVHTLSLLTFLGWVLFTAAEWQVALLHAVTVLIITCPCALGLAVPVVQVLASSLLMRRGVLLKSGDALEKLAQVDTVVFDKTGTLTTGKLTLVESAKSVDEKSFQLAASMASRSAHPLSRSLAEHYQGDLLPLSVTEIAGCGLEATYQGQSVRLGSRAWLDIAENSDESGAELWLAREGHAPIRFAFADSIKTDGAKIMAGLKGLGLRTMLFSGDRDLEVARVAQALDISDHQARMKPADKTAAIERLQKAGHKVLFVGDGLNDAPSLAAAHVSMSPSTAVDISQNAADIVFQGALISPVKVALMVARKSESLIKQNFGLAILYNTIAVPFAILGFVTPMIAAIAMSSSSLVVIANSFRLRGEEKDKV